MRRGRILPVVVLFGAVGLTACEADDPLVFEPGQFAGNWSATSIVYTETATGDQLDAVAALGASLTLSITQTGAFTGVFNLPPAGLNNVPISGSISNVTATEADVAFVWPPPLDQQPPLGDFRATYTLSTNLVSFTNPSTTHPITQTAASVTITMARN
jgi:hypothetical protein